MGVTKKIYCVETKQEFNSIKEASEILGINSASLCEHLKHKRASITKDKLHFRYC